MSVTSLLSAAVTAAIHHFKRGAERVPSCRLKTRREQGMKEAIKQSSTSKSAVVLQQVVFVLSRRFLNGVVTVADCFHLYAPIGMSEGVS